MQKALILALLIGAFLFSRYVTAQETELPAFHCPLGGKLMEYENEQICYVGAPSGEMFGFKQGVRKPKPSDACTSSAAGYLAATREANSNPAVNWHTSSGELSGNFPSHSCKRTLLYTGTRTDGTTYSGSTYDIDNTMDRYPSAPYCPPDAPPLYTKMGGTAPNIFCYEFAEALPPDEPPPPDCDDVVGNCTPPEEPPKCFRGGAGQEVCFEDPNEKCDVNSVNGEPVFTNCQAGCGFINGEFMCSDEPDIPNLDDCLVTTNGYACPGEIPDPDDTIDDPEKALPDMVKGDFKDVLKGVETRTDATNKLLSDQIARDAENTEKLALGLGKANQYLSAIDKNTKAIADGIEGLETDGESADFGNVNQYKGELNAMLGITGEESIDDLTVGEVNLGNLKDDFSFSLGASNCPQPRAINMLGKTFYMEWGPYCEAFTVMGYLIMAAAYFMAAMIAFKGK